MAYNTRRMKSHVAQAILHWQKWGKIDSLTRAPDDDLTIPPTQLYRSSPPRLNDGTAALAASLLASKPTPETLQPRFQSSVRSLVRVQPRRKNLQRAQPSTQYSRLLFLFFDKGLMVRECLRDLPRSGYLGRHRVANSAQLPRVGASVERLQHALQHPQRRYAQES